ncbi:sulfotransferase [Thermodesulfobacteriota bacterium]
MKKTISEIELLRHKATNRISQRLSVTLAKLKPDFFAEQVKKPIFLLGCFRSGTSLVSRLLGMHDEIANWSEANNIWNPQWHPWRPSDEEAFPLEYDPASFTKRWWDNNKARQKEIKAIFGAYCWLQRKPFFLNKSPYNTFRIPYLLEMFPESRFINLQRDGRGVAYSHAIKLTNQKLPEWPKPQRDAFSNSFDEFVVWLASFWKITMEEMAYQDEALELTKNGILLSLTYEDFCVDPKGNLNRICQYIGVEPTPFLRAVENERVISKNYKWKENLSQDVVGRMEMAMEPALSQYGYK